MLKGPRHIAIKAAENLLKATKAPATPASPVEPPTPPIPDPATGGAKKFLGRLANTPKVRNALMPTELGPPLTASDRVKMDRTVIERAVGYENEASLREAAGPTYTDEAQRLAKRYRTANPNIPFLQDISSKSLNRKVPLFAAPHLPGYNGIFIPGDDQRSDRIRINLPFALRLGELRGGVPSLLRHELVHGTQAGAQRRYYDARRDAVSAINDGSPTKEIGRLIAKYKALDSSAPRESMKDVIKGWSQADYHLRPEEIEASLHELKHRHWMRTGKHITTPAQALRLMQERHESPKRGGDFWPRAFRGSVWPAIPGLWRSLRHQDAMGKGKSVQKLYEKLAPFMPGIVQGPTTNQAKAAALALLR